ncbi:MULTISPECIES: hydroxyisourate hydrolase [Microbacterium]|uniref:hydroxyisourate hydrolase n=1 Tax=Microbacterium TaxID=33882 RepID=UPI003F995BBE
MPHLTTHVLDAALGCPAFGVAVSLSTDDGAPIARTTTDSDGRAGLGPDWLAPGTYEIRFATGDYFARLGTETFYPSIAVSFRVTGDEHLHVPILLSPFAYSTYKGS